MTVWRAFLIVVLPGYGLWLLARDNPSGRQPGRPFSRRPSWFDLAWVSLGVGILAAGLIADSRFLEFCGAVYSVAAAYRLAIRLFSPSGWFRTEVEFLSAANVRSLTRLALYGFLIWLVVTQRWSSVELVAAAVALLVIVETLMVLAAFAIGSRILRRKQLAKT